MTSKKNNQPFHCDWKEIVFLKVISFHDPFRIFASNSEHDKNNANELWTMQSFLQHTTLMVIGDTQKEKSLHSVFNTKEQWMWIQQQYEIRICMIELSQVHNETETERKKNDGWNFSDHVMANGDCFLCYDRTFTIENRRQMHCESPAE